MVDFGAVVIAETVERSVTVHNDGALSCHLSICGDIVDKLKEIQTASNGKSCNTLTLNLQKLTNVLMSSTRACSVRCGERREK